MAPTATTTADSVSSLEIPDDSRVPVPARTTLVRDAPTDVPVHTDPPVHSDQIEQIITALAAAQGEFGEIERAHTARVQSRRTNSEYTYEYEDMAAVLAAVRPALSKNGLALVQLPTTRKNGISLMTMLAHGSGQWIRGYLALPCDTGDPQAIGSAISYARRYAAKAMLGLAPSESDEDDGARASRAPQPAQRASDRRDERREERREAPRDQKPAAPAAASPPTRPDPVGTITRLADRSNGVLVQLSSGFIFAARDPEAIESLRQAQKAEKTITVECQASADPVRIAPLLVDFRTT